MTQAEEIAAEEKRYNRIIDIADELVECLDDLVNQASDSEAFIEARIKGRALLAYVETGALA